MALLKLSETLAVGCGSAEATALRALRAATWAGVACCGAGMLSQKPRALMMSAGVCGAAACGLGWAFSAAAVTVAEAEAEAASAGFDEVTVLASAEANCRVEAAGFAGLSAGLAVATTVVLTGFSFLTGAGAAPSSSSSLALDLLL